MRTVTYTPLLALLTSLCYAQSIDIPMALTNPAQTTHTKTDRTMMFRFQFKNNLPTLDMRFTRA